MPGATGSATMTVRAVTAIRAAITAIKPDVKMAINTLPFFLDDFDNAVEEVFGQSPARLAAVSDVFEVMAYHQILRQIPPGRAGSPPTSSAAAPVRRCARCRAARSIWKACMRAVAAPSASTRTNSSGLSMASRRSEAEGICVFTFTDFSGHARYGRRSPAHRTAAGIPS